MVKKYNGFLLENLKMNFELLLEGFISASASFMDKLKKLSKESGSVGDIAKEIFKFIEDDFYISDERISQNFFDVTDKEGIVSFLMNSKIDEDDVDNDPSLPYTMKGRGEIKIGKVIKYILEIMDQYGQLEMDLPKDKDIESFVNAYKATKVSSNMKFKFLKGEDIGKYYNGKKYMSVSGSLGGSCMSDEKKSLFRIYSENDNKVKLLVLIDEETDKTFLS